MSTPLSTVYCTDENIAVRAPEDYSDLAPAHQCLAYGTDGVITSGDRWTLTSTLVDFAASGVVAGNVVRLEKTNVFQPDGELFGVVAASGHSLTLRRLGITGSGAPPGPVAGATAIRFTIETLGPQIENASWDLNRLFAIDADTPGRSPSSLHDLRDLRKACELMVLVERYTLGARTEGNFKVKAGLFKTELSEALSRLQVRWAPTTGNDNPPPSTWFSTRLVR